MNYKQLTFAREYRGYTQTELSGLIDGLSQSNLSKFEKGMGVLSEELQNRIINFLNFPSEFFEAKINSSIENGNYRKKATITKSAIQHFENKCRLIGYIVDELTASIDWPEFNFAPLNVEEGYSPAEIANRNRAHLQLDKDLPIKSICSLLEANGIILYQIDADEKFDGVSFVSNAGMPIIIVNKNFSNDRKRFTIAHELGHILMHNENLFPVSSYRNKEMEANIFAAQFLMPEAAIKNSLRRLKMSDLGDLKSYWLTSMGAIIRRARDLQCIDDSRYRFFMIEMSRYGYSKKEPIEVPIDEPTCFKNAYRLLETELGYSQEDFINYLSLPADVIEELLTFDQMVKLKVLKLPNR